jgi:hypothetical protein
VCVCLCRFACDRAGVCGAGVRVCVRASESVCVCVCTRAPAKCGVVNVKGRGTHAVHKRGSDGAQQNKLCRRTWHCVKLWTFVTGPPPGKKEKLTVPSCTVNTELRCRTISMAEYKHSYKGPG